MACTITINGTKYTEKQFKNLLKMGLLYNSMERGLVTLPVEVGVITKPETEQTKFRRNFPFSKEDVKLAMINIFGLDTKEANANAEIADRMAGEFARRNNKTKEDFYKTLVYIKPATPQIEVTPNLLFSELADFEFVDMMEFEDNPSRSSYIVNRNGQEVGVVEINQNELGEYYVSWFTRTGGETGDGVRILKTTMQNLINKGLPVAIDTAITPAGFAAMQKLADEGFLIKVGEEIKEENQRSLKPSIYETPPFIINPEVVPNNDKLLFQRPAQVIAAVAKGFNLEQNPKGFGLAFNTKNQKASPELASRINTWMAQNNLSGVKFYYEKLYGTINAIVQPQSNMLFQESTNSVVFNFLVSPKFKELENKIVSKQTIENLLKGTGIRQYEKEVAKQVLDSITNNKFDFNIFKDAVNSFAIPLGIEEQNTAADNLTIEELKVLAPIDDISIDVYDNILTYSNLIGSNSLVEIRDFLDEETNTTAKEYELKNRKHSFKTTMQSLVYLNSALSSYSDGYVDYGFDRIGVDNKSTPGLLKFTLDKGINTNVGKASQFKHYKVYGGKGLFGHVRYFIKNGKFYIGEIQSDLYQNDIDLPTSQVILEKLGITSKTFTIGSEEQRDKFLTTLENDKVDNQQFSYIASRNIIYSNLLDAPLDKVFTIGDFVDPQIVFYKNLYQRRLFNETVAFAKSKGFTDIYLASEDTVATIEWNKGAGLVFTPINIIGNYEVGSKVEYLNKEWTVLESNPEENYIGVILSEEFESLSTQYDNDIQALKNRGMSREDFSDIIKKFEDGVIEYEDARNQVNKRFKIDNSYGGSMIFEVVVRNDKFDFIYANSNSSEVLGLDEAKLSKKEQNLLKNVYGDLIKNNKNVLELVNENFNNEESTWYKINVQDSKFNQVLLYQQAQAAILIGQEVADIIYALQNPNVSSPIHELAHKWEKELTEEERNQVLDFAKENNVDISNGWTREVSEAFARGFEKYLAEGIAPTPALERIFKQFAEWLTTIYKGIVGSEIDINLNNDMRKIYATMLGENFETTIKEEVAAEQAAPVVEEINTIPLEAYKEYINLLSEDTIDLLYDEMPMNLLPATDDVTLEDRKSTIYGAYYRAKPLNNPKYNSFINLVEQAIEQNSGITQPSVSIEAAEIVPDAVDWRSPVTESTQDIDAKKQAIQLAYDNKSFDAALESGALSLEEVERIIVSAGLPIKMVDNIMFRMNNPEATYTVKGLLSMKVNDIFQQVATYFLETGLLYEAIMRNTNNIESGLAKELLDKITPDENSPSYVKFRDKVIELYNNNLAELERIKQEDLFKKNGFKVGDAVLFQGTKFIIIDEQIDGNKRFVGFLLKNALNTKAGSVEDVRQISEWTEELEKEFVVNNKIKELKEELGLNYTKPVNTVSVKQDVNSLNLKYPTFDDVKNKGVSAQSYSQILLMSRKFASMFPFMNIEIGYLDNDTKGHVYGNTIIINLKNATKDTPIHELLHPFMFVLKKENPKLYAGLLGEFKNNTNVYNVWMEDVKANPFYSTQLENIQEEEAFIQYLGELIADMHDDKGNFIDVEVFIRIKNNTPKKKKEVDLEVEDDFDVTDYAVEDAKLEKLLENATIAEIEQTIFEEDSTDGKTQKDYEALGYVVVGEVESVKGVEGRTFKSIKMVHPKMEKITSTFKEKFYNWFRDLLKKLIGVDKGGARKVKFSEWNLAQYDPTLEVVSFFKPAENRAERLEKVEKLDSEGRVISTKKVRTQRRDDKPSYTVSVDKLENELRERGASELEISDFMYQVNGHQFESFILKINLEDSYVPSLDNLQENIKNKDTAFFSGTRRVIDFKDLPTDLSINDLASMFSMVGPGIKFDLEPHQDALTKLEAYQYSNNDVAKDLIERTEKRVKILTATDARIGIESSPTVKSESFAVKELLNKYKDVEFIEAYVRQGISALADAAKMIKYIKEAIKDGEAADEVMNQTLNRDLREAQALMAFYDDVASLIEKNEKMFEQEDLDYFNSIMTRATSRRREINSILVDLITEWLFPTISGSQKNIDTKEALTKEEFKKNVRAATSDVNLVSYFGQAPVNSRDPLMAALAIKVKDELNKNYREEENSLQRLRVLYDDFLKATGISNTTKAVEEYYKANFLRKAKVWELVAIEKGGVKRYDYVERWAFHEEYLADVHAEARRQEIERLKKQLGEPNNYDERLIFNERLTAWDNANPLQSAKFRNPAFSNLKSNEYYMFLYDMYKKANDKYADRRLDFGIIPQAYNSPNALEKAKKVAQYTTEVLKGDKKAASKLKELGVSVANSIFDKNSFEKVQALNLDGSYHMSVKSPFTHLLDEQFLSFRLNESVYGFSTSANAYNTLRSNQANVENLKLLINGNTKLGIQARKVLKSKIKTRDGITSSEMVWDVLEGMPPQDKEQSAKLLTKQMNAYINDTFYGVSEIGGEFNVGPVVINVNKIADNLGFFTALLNMAGNLIAGVSNITVGNAMSLGESFGGKFYTPKDWIAAQGIYFKEFLTGKFMADAIDPVKSKITQLGIMHDAIQGEFRDKYGKNITGNVLQRYFTKDTLFIINHIAEHQIQLTGMLALMNSTKVKLKDGSEINLYDAYVKNDKGFYKLRPDAIWSEKQQQEFIRTLHGISRDLNGNYAAYDKAMIQRYALGKLALQYRKYLYTAWRSRFASKRYDYEKGTTQEGYYRAFLKALYADIKEFNLSSLTRTLLDPRVSDRKLTDEQKYAIRKTRYDIVMVIGLTMLSTMLATAEAEAPDDDEDNYWRQLLLLVSLRLRSDLSSYSITAPQELHKILTNPSASFNTVTKFTEFLGQLTNDVQNGQFETYERRTGNNEAGDLKVVGKFEKLIPVYRQWLRLQNPEDQLKYYDLINKNVKPSN